MNPPPRETKNPPPPPPDPPLLLPIFQFSDHCALPSAFPPPLQLIHHTIDNFNISPDRLAVSRIAESLSTLQQARELRLRDGESSLRKLARQLNTLSAQYDELVDMHSAHDHASRIASLDTRKFRTAKAASDAETDAERLALQAADLSARLQELELQGADGGGGGGGEEGGAGAGVGGGGNTITGTGNSRRKGAAAAAAAAAVDDEVLLRLKVYRSLGIDIERDEENGEWAKAVVRNDRKADVHVVNMDKKFSRYFYANYFWQTL